MLHELQSHDCLKIMVLEAFNLRRRVVDLFGSLTMPSAMAEICAGLRRVLLAFVPAPSARSPAPIAAAANEVPKVHAQPAPAPQVLAPPAPAPTLLQQQFLEEEKAAKQKVQDLVKRYRAMNGGPMNRMQQIEVDNLFRSLIKTAQLKKMEGEEEEARSQARFSIASLLSPFD